MPNFFTIISLSYYPRPPPPCLSLCYQTLWHIETLNKGKEIVFAINLVQAAYLRLNMFLRFLVHGIYLPKIVSLWLRSNYPTTVTVSV